MGREISRTELTERRQVCIFIYMNKKETTMPSTTPLSQTHFPVLDPYRSGTLYFETEAGRQEYLAANKHAMAVTGSPASTADRIVHR